MNEKGNGSLFKIQNQENGFPLSNESVKPLYGSLWLCTANLVRCSVMINLYVIVLILVYMILEFSVIIIA